MIATMYRESRVCRHGPRCYTYLSSHFHMSKKWPLLNSDEISYRWWHQGSEGLLNKMTPWRKDTRDLSHFPTPPPPPTGWPQSSFSFLKIHSLSKDKKINYSIEQALKWHEVLHCRKVILCKLHSKKAAVSQRHFPEGRRWLNTTPDSLWVVGKGFSFFFSHI